MQRGVSTPSRQLASIVGPVVLGVRTLGTFASFNWPRRQRLQVTAHACAADPTALNPQYPARRQHLCAEQCGSSSGAPSTTVSLNMIWPLAWAYLRGTCGGCSEITWVRHRTNSLGQGAPISLDACWTKLTSPCVTSPSRLSSPALPSSN